MNGGDETSGLPDLGFEADAGCRIGKSEIPNRKSRQSPRRATRIGAGGAVGGDETGGEGGQAERGEDDGGEPVAGERHRGHGVAEEALHGDIAGEAEDHAEGEEQDALAERIMETMEAVVGTEGDAHADVAGARWAVRWAITP